jgi:hypothetical protein
MKIKYDKYWGDFEKINPLLFVAAVLNPHYKIIILEFWFKSNVGEEKAEDYHQIEEYIGAVV